MTAKRWIWMASAGALGLALCAPLSAETLRGALVKAYLTNPTLTAARAGQRATDENVPLQKAAGRPFASAGADYTENVVLPNNAFNAARRTFGADVTLSVPIYSGGSVRNGIRSAEKRVESGRAFLRATESSVFSQTVAAYMDVIRDSAVVELTTANVGVLDVNLQATRDRFEVGDLTRTDIAQSESRLALARSDLQTAQANLIGSRESFIRLVGTVPDTLEPPPPLPNLPASPDMAVDVALANNPDILSAQKDREAATYDVKVARAEALPTVSAFSQGSYSDNLNSVRNVPGTVSANSSRQASVGLSATIPLYQGGRPAALVRQAQARESQAIERVTETERSVVAQVRASYASWQAALQVVDSSQKAIDAASLSLEGVRAENTVGNRTILDILNAEQELLNAKVELVFARRNAYVAGFTLLAAMGQAEADDLGLDVGPLYDPVANYDRVKNRLTDWGGDPTPQPVATRTVDTPAQNANVMPLTTP